MPSFFALNLDKFHKAERTARVAALSDDEKRRMLRWVTGIRCSGYNYIPISSEKAEDILVEKVFWPAVTAESCLW